MSPITASLLAYAAKSGFLGGAAAWAQLGVMITSLVKRFAYNSALQALPRKRPSPFPNSCKQPPHSVAPTSARRPRRSPASAADRQLWLRH